MLTLRVLVCRKTLNLYRKFQFIGNFKVTRCFVTIVGLIFNGWNAISKCMVLLENNVLFLLKKLEKGHFF